jgi:hypothetical protein
MSRRRKRDENLANIAYINFFAILAKAAMVLLLASLAMIAINQKQAQDDGIKPKAEYVIEVHWPDYSPHDVDVWLLPPDNRPIFYSHLDNGIVYLDRDDRGYNDVQNFNGQMVEAPNRSEVISIRGIMPGEYILNVFLYSYVLPHDSSVPTFVAPTLNKVGAPLPENVPVHVEIKKINPTIVVVYSGTVTFTRSRQELHVTRFNLNADGTITDIRNDLPASILGKSYQGESFIPPAGASQ